MNKVFLIGNLGQDPEIFTTEQGSKVATMSLATSETYTDKNGNKVTNTEWHTIKAWEGKATLIEKYLKKGAKVLIEGKIKTRSFEKDGETKYRTEIIVDNLEFLTPKGDNT